MSEYVAVIGKSRTGYSAHVPDLPGCVATGRSIKETEELIRGAIKMHLQGMREDGGPIPKATTVVKKIRVAS